ncbi:hypothetical protein TYRP_017790 [Tyrophagus putrescentiae]|nr:hypothetical protein TYRP_017790 [Tyrophagus putrescentiae]
MFLFAGHVLPFLSLLTTHGTPLATEQQSPLTVTEEQQQQQAHLRSPGPRLASLATVDQRSVPPVTPLPPSTHCPLRPPLSTSAHRLQHLHHPPSTLSERPPATTLRGSLVASLC